MGHVGVAEFQRRPMAIDDVERRYRSHWREVKWFRQHTVRDVAGDLTQIRQLDQRETRWRQNPGHLPQSQGNFVRPKMFQIVRRINCIYRIVWNDTYVGQVGDYIWLNPGIDVEPDFIPTCAKHKR